MIITFIYDNFTLKIDKKYLYNESYLYNSFELYEKDENILINKIENVTYKDFQEYILYLSLKDFKITEGFLKLLDYDVQIYNSQNLPDDYFKIKIKEDIIRNHFYKLELYKEDYFNLIKQDNLNINKNTIELFDNILKYFEGNAIIAGGSILTENFKYSDIDIFIIKDNKNILEQLFSIKELIYKDEIYLKNSILISKHAITINFLNLSFRERREIELQVILRLYKSKAIKKLFK